jgi:N6-L-threonylcarbamoyladenine synthase
MENYALRATRRRVFELPIPLTKPDWKHQIAFSFSGLKSAVARTVQAESLSEADTCDLAAQVQDAVCMHIEQKTRLALDWCRQHDVALTCIVASGGVASNHRLRTSLTACAASQQLACYFPPPHLCTDNGVMIAWTAHELADTHTTTDYTIDPIPKWPLV